MSFIKNTEEWISKLNIGDKVYQVERNYQYPNSIAKWEAKVIRIESNFIETEYRRDMYCVWLQELVRGLIDKHRLLTNHRTFDKVKEKNYYTPDGTINIEQLIET